MVQQLADLIWENINKPLFDSLGISTEKTFIKHSSYAVLGFFVITILFGLNMLAGMMMKDDGEDGDNKKVHTSGKASGSKKAKADKSTFKGLAIVGACGAGKTTLFYQLMTGEFRDTISSLEENYTGKEGSNVCKLKKDGE